MNDLRRWQSTWKEKARTRRPMRGTVVALTLAMSGLGGPASGQQPEQIERQPPVATFRSSVDLVRVSAVVRDKKGRFVTDLTSRDFEVLDGGIPRRITDFR